MADLAALRSIFDHNHGLRLKAAELNARAGSAVFPVMTEAELRAWIAGRLSGATSVASIADPEVLRLPPLDPALIAQVERENPLMINVGGVDLAVDYKTTPPIVTVDYKSAALRALPADQLRLPGGRAVAVRVRFGSWETSSSTPDLAQLRLEAVGAARRAHWERWSRPAVDVPQFLYSPLPLPELREECFGSNPFTGEQYLAWGTFTWSAVQGFHMQWFDDQSAAEAAREVARIRLGEIHGATWSDTVRTTRSARRSRSRPTPLPVPVPTAPARTAVPFSAPYVPCFRREPAQGWVIAPNGLLREPDRTEHIRRYEPEGTMHWNDVKADELVIRRTRDAAGDHCEVVQRPTPGLTAAQLRSVTTLETEHGLPPGSFGLDPIDVV